MELKDKLYNLRKKNGYTQSEIAEILEVSRQSVSNWELGTILPSTSRLKKLSNLYSVPLETLLDDGIEIPLHSESIQVEDVQDETPEIVESSPVESENKTHRKKKNILVSVLGILLALIVGVSLYFVATSGSANGNPTLEQLGNEEVSVSSGNGFELQ